MALPASIYSIALLTAITLVLAFVAIRRSRKRLQTTLCIVAAILVCGLVGAVIGLSSVNPNAAGFVAFLFSGIAVAAILEVIGFRRRSKTHQTIFCFGTVILACGLVGAAIRLAFVNSHAAGTLAAVFMQVGGIAISIEQIRKYRDGGPP